MARSELHAGTHRGSDERRGGSAEGKAASGDGSIDVDVSAMASFDDDVAEVTEVDARPVRTEAKASMRCAQLEATSTARRILRRISTPLGMPATPAPRK